jgi:formamidopyrimidine-DNA glycosylase
MDDGTEVCTIDTSRFGRIRAVDAEDAISVPPLSLLARDAWLDLPSAKDFRADLTCRTAPIKTVLLDQNAAVSGLGNYNVDEVLFHARIHPRQPSYTLDMQQTVALHSAIELVAAKVMEVDADTKKLPKTWLYKHRYGRKNGVGQIFTMVHNLCPPVCHLLILRL